MPIKYVCVYDMSKEADKRLIGKHPIVTHLDIEKDINFILPTLPTNQYYRKCIENTSIVYFPSASETVPTAGVTSVIPIVTPISGILDSLSAIVPFIRCTRCAMQSAGSIISIKNRFLNMIVFYSLKDRQRKIDLIIAAQRPEV